MPSYAIISQETLDTGIIEYYAVLKNSLDQTRKECVFGDDIRALEQAVINYERETVPQDNEEELSFVNVTMPS